MRTTFALIALLGCTVVASTAQAATYNNLVVAFDRWMYPFNGTPGTRGTGSTFGAVGEAAFDDRDAQTIVGFDLSSIGGLAANETVVSATVRVTIAAHEVFRYDPTYDDYTTYNGGTDTDTGRPMEIYGVATRHGFTGLTLDDGSVDPLLFKENSPYTPNPFPAKENRSAYASDYRLESGTPRDISNNVVDGFNPDPWGVGQINSLAAGALVPINSEVTFTLDLSNPRVLSYLNGAVDDGQVFFALSSLHPAAEQGPVEFPSFYTFATSGSLGTTARLDIEIGEAVPEPSSVALSLCGLTLLGGFAWRQRRRAV